MAQGRPALQAGAPGRIEAASRRQAGRIGGSRPTQPFCATAVITLGRAQSLLNTPAGQRSSRVDDARGERRRSQAAQLAGGPGAAQAARADQPRLYRDQGAVRRASWPSRTAITDRQRGQPHLRRAHHHRQPGPDVRAVPGLAARRARPAQPLCRQGRVRGGDDEAWCCRTAPATASPASSTTSTHGGSQHRHPDAARGDAQPAAARGPEGRRPRQPRAGRRLSS